MANKGVMYEQMKTIAQIGMGYGSNGIHIANFKLHDDSSVQLMDYGNFVETAGLRQTYHLNGLNPG